MVLHVLLGQVGQQRLHLVLEGGLLGKDAPLLLGFGTERAEFWVVGDVEEALAVLGPMPSAMRECHSKGIGGGGLTRRSSHFWSSVTHFVFPGDSSMWYFWVSLGTLGSPSGYRTAASGSPGSTKRALTAGSSRASSDALETFMVGCGDGRGGGVGGWVVTGKWRGVLQLRSVGRLVGGGIGNGEWGMEGRGCVV